MERIAERLRTHERNIDRYQKLLKTKLSATEIRFVEQRISEERFTLAMLQFMSSNDQSTIQLPDAIQ